MAERLGVPVQQVEEALAAQGAFTPASTDAAAPDEAPVSERLASEESGYAEVEDRETVRALTRGLSRQDRRLLELRYWRERSQAEIGRDTGVTESQVSRQLGVVLKRLRAPDARRATGSARPAQRGGRPEGVQSCFGTSPAASWATGSKSCCERSSSKFTARSRIGTPQVSPLSPSTRVIAQAKRAMVKGPVPSPTLKKSGIAALSRK